MAELIHNGSKCIRVNNNGGIYHHGVVKPLVEKLRVARLFLELENEEDGSSVISSRRLAKAAQCSRKFAEKIIDELRIDQCLLDPDEQKTSKKSWKEKDFGAKSLSTEDEELLLQLRSAIPGRSLANYQRCLFQTNGTLVSVSLISHWFLYRFPYRGSMRKTNPVPIAKFSAINIERFHHYAAWISMVDQTKIKFIDEKSLKALELFGRLTRADPMTGEVPPQLVPKDFRVRYCIIGLCGLDPTMAPLVYDVSQENTTADRFMWFLEQCIIKGDLKRFDVVVLDNAPWHTKGAAAHVEEFLWNAVSPIDGHPMQILCVFLPTYSAELNPIELVWNVFLKKNRDEILLRFSRGELNFEHAIAYCASESMRMITHKDIAGCYHYCGYLDQQI